MVSMEVSKTLGPGSSPGTPAINYLDRLSGRSNGPGEMIGSFE